MIWYFIYIKTHHQSPCQKSNLLFFYFFYYFGWLSPMLFITFFPFYTFWIAPVFFSQKKFVIFSKLTIFKCKLYEWLYPSFSSFTITNFNIIQSFFFLRFLSLSYYHAAFPFRSIFNLEWQYSCVFLSSERWNFY